MLLEIFLPEQRPERKCRRWCSPRVNADAPTCARPSYASFASLLERLTRVRRVHLLGLF
jgi:hypothetical protein